MPSKTQKSLEALMVYIKQSKNRRATILRGQGKQYRRYKFQLNLNAEDSTLKEKAAQDSHKVYSTADVEIKDDRTEEEEEQAMQEFEEEMSKNLKE
ncbi:hypothetical protein BDW67DRAFT_186820 [Aspergillus spinulosporus]